MGVVHARGSGDGINMKETSGIDSAKWKTINLVPYNDIMRKYNFKSNFEKFQPQKKGVAHKKFSPRF